MHSPDDASGMFDVLTYQKGAGILRMLERYLGADRFRDGIRLYLGRHAYGNTETHDLWNDIEEASGEPVRRIMDQWIWQGGYPLLTVSLDAGGIRIDQRRFLADGGADHAVWDVPLRVRVLGGEERSVLVPADGVVVDVPADAAVVVNAEASSFVRVRYEGDLLERLTSRLSELSPLERYGLVDDHWAAVSSGAAPASEFVAAAARFGDEDDIAVWQVLLMGLTWCDRFLDGEPRERLRTFVRRLIAPAMDRLGWEADADEPDRVRALRGALLQGLGVLGADPNAEAAAREFEAESRAGKPVDASLAAAAVNVVAFNGDEADFEHYWTAYRGVAEPAGAVPLPVRAAAVPRRGVVRPHRRGGLRRRHQEPGRTVRVRLRDGEPRPRRPRLAGAARALERGRGTLPAAAHDPPGRRRALPHAARTGRRGRGVLRRAPDPAVGEDARADAGTPAGCRSAAGAGDARPRGVLLRLRAAVGVA